MPLENQAGEKSATQPHHAESDRWAEVSAILLDDAPISGALGERLRTYNNAELMMCGELEKFSADKFELVDTDKDGFISQLETKKALTNPPVGVRKEMLQYVQKNMSDLEELANDEWFDENDGVTKKDIAKFDSELHVRLDLRLADGIRSSLRRENLTDLVSVIREAHDRPNCLDYILHRVACDLPGDRIESRLDFYNKVENVNGINVGKVNIACQTSLYDRHFLTISTDPKVPVKASIQTSSLFYEDKWRPVDPNTALDYIGDEARTMRIHHVP